jgi:hypothetical protein
MIAFFWRALCGPGMSGAWPNYPKKDDGCSMGGMDDADRLGFIYSTVVKTPLTMPGAVFM